MNKRERLKIALLIVLIIIAIFTKKIFINKTNNSLDVVSTAITKSIINNDKAAYVFGLNKNESTLV